LRKKDVLLAPGVRRERSSLDLSLFLRWFPGKFKIPLYGKPIFTRMPPATSIDFCGSLLVLARKPFFAFKRRVGLGTYRMKNHMKK
jgi:hypothetical protein